MSSGNFGEIVDSLRVKTTKDIVDNIKKKLASRSLMEAEGCYFHNGIEYAMKNFEEILEEVLKGI